MVESRILAKDELILVTSRSVVDLFNPDEQTFANVQLWKDLHNRTCTIPLWSDEFQGQQVEVWGDPLLVNGSV